MLVSAHTHARMYLSNVSVCACVYVYAEAQVLAHIHMRSSSSDHSLSNVNSAEAKLHQFDVEIFPVPDINLFLFG